MIDKSALRRIVRETLIVKNPALIEAVGLFLAIAVATSLKAAVLVSFATFMVLNIVAMLANLFMKRLPRFLRVALYTAVGAALLLPLSLLYTKIAPNETAALGIALPLVSVSSLVLLHCERYYVKLSLTETALHACFSGIGYGAVVLPLGAVRELLGSGTLWGFPIKGIPKASFLLLPAGGLLALGFLAAALRVLRIRLYPHYSERAASDIVMEDKRHE